MEKDLLWSSRPDSVGDHEVVMAADHFCLWYSLEGNLLSDLLISRAEVMLLLDLRLLLAKGIRMAAEGLLLWLGHLLFSCILLLLTVGARGSVEYQKLLCSQGSPAAL